MAICIIIYSALYKRIFCVFNVLGKSCIYKWNLKKVLKKLKGLSRFKCRPLPRPKSNRQVKGHHLQEEGNEEKR